MSQMTQPKPSLLLFSAQGADSDYEALRLDPKHPNVRDFIEAMWEEYQPYADTDSLQGARNHDFRSRYWELYVVAVNTSKLPHVPDLDPPRIARAVLGLGLPEVSVDRVSGAFSDWRFQSQPQIVRRPSGKAVSTRVVLESRCAGHPDYAGYEGISAVLSSDMNPFNACEPWFDHTKFIIGDDYCLVHNPRAANPLPQGFLKVGREYWVGDEGVLKSNLWFKALQR